MSQALTILDPQSPATFFADRAAALTQSWEEARNGMRRVVAFGLLMLDTKEQGKTTGEIPHGQFQKWLTQNCPDIPYRTSAQYMQLAAEIVRRSQKCGSCTFENLPLHQVLLTPTDSLDSLPKEAVEIRDEIFSLVDGKSQRQLLFEFREEKTPAPKKHHPRKPVDPKAAAEAESADAREFKTTALGHLAQMRDHTFAALLKKLDHEEIINACVETANFYRTLSKKK